VSYSCWITNPSAKLFLTVFRDWYNIYREVILEETVESQEEIISQELLEILACPACKSEIEYDRESQKLICVGECQRRYLIRDGIPVMLIDEAELPTN